MSSMDQRFTYTISTTWQSRRWKPMERERLLRAGNLPGVTEWVSNQARILNPALSESGVHVHLLLQLASGHSCPTCLAGPGCLS